MPSRTSRREFLTGAARLAAGGALVAVGAGVRFDAGRAAAAAEQSVPVPPPVSAVAAYAFDASSGVELYALDPDRPLPPGSTAKIATALVTRAQLALDEVVLIDPSDEVDPAVYSNMGIIGGDSLTVEQLLNGLLIPSGSDAALALARTAGARLHGGDATNPAAARAAFVEAMNGLTSAFGLVATNFVNPSGDDAEGIASSARDLARLGAELLKDKTLAGIVRTPEMDITTVGPEQRALQPKKNTNVLLTEDPAVIGIKTGATPLAGTCLVAARRYGGNRVVSVVLGSAGHFNEEALVEGDGRWDDTRAIFAGLDQDYRWVAPAAVGAIPGLAEELAAWQVALAPGPDLTLRAADAGQLGYRLVLGPPGAPKSNVGRVEFFLGTTKIGERTVVQTGAAS
jgi:serine-type D-Ala-D-Ala carboxypeptidase (penicillin-binding protein 5/6)